MPSLPVCGLADPAGNEGRFEHPRLKEQFGRKWLDAVMKLKELIDAMQQASFDGTHTAMCQRQGRPDGRPCFDAACLPLDERLKAY